MSSTLSFCSIVKNEEKFLFGMLESVASVADEIIITDTGSTDNTVQIAKDFGAKVFEYEWNNSFADARNFGVQKASKDWIFSIDADERLINPENLKKYLDVQNITYFIKIFSAKDASKYDEKSRYHCNTRLFPNNDDFQYFCAIHEQLIGVDDQKYTNILIKDFHLIHYGYDLSPEIMKLKHERNMKLIYSELESDNIKVKYYFNFLLGREYLAQSKFNEGIKYLNIAFNDPYMKYPVNIHIITNLLKGYYMIKDWTNLENMFKNYNKIALINPDFCLFYGLYLDKICNKPNEAIFYYYKLLNFKEENNPYLIYDYASITWRPLYLIAVIYLNKKDFIRGIDYLNQALETHFYDTSIIHNLIIEYSNYGKKILAREIFEIYKNNFTTNEFLNLKNILK